MKTILLGVLLMISSNAFANDWKAVVESVDNDVLYVDAKSFDLSKTKKGIYVFNAIMKYEDKHGASDGIFISGILAEDCLDKESGRIFDMYTGANDPQVGNWSMTGKTMIDKQGQILCLTLKEIIKVHNRKETNQYDQKKNINKYTM